MRWEAGGWVDGLQAGEPPRGQRGRGTSRGSRGVSEFCAEDARLGPE